MSLKQHCCLSSAYNWTFITTNIWYFDYYLKIAPIFLTCLLSQMKCKNICKKGLLQIFFIYEKNKFIAHISIVFHALSIEVHVLIHVYTGNNHFEIVFLYISLFLHVTRICLKQYVFSCISVALCHSFVTLCTPHLYTEYTPSHPLYIFPFCQC